MDVWVILPLHFILDLLSFLCVCVCVLCFLCFVSFSVMKMTDMHFRHFYLMVWGLSLWEREERNIVDKKGRGLGIQPLRHILYVSSRLCLLILIPATTEPG